MSNSIKKLIKTSNVMGFLIKLNIDNRKIW